MLTRLALSFVSEWFSFPELVSSFSCTRYPWMDRLDVRPTPQHSPAQSLQKCFNFSLFACWHCHPWVSSGLCNTWQIHHLMGQQTHDHIPSVTSSLLSPMLEKMLQNLSSFLSNNSKYSSLWESILLLYLLSEELLLVYRRYQMRLLSHADQK